MDSTIDRIGGSLKPASRPSGKLCSRSGSKPGALDLRKIFERTMLRLGAKNKLISSTNRPVSKTLEGKLEYGQKTLYRLSGIDLYTDSNTWIFGELEVGVSVRARVMGLERGDGSCTSIVVKSSGI